MMRSTLKKNRILKNRLLPEKLKLGQNLPDPPNFDGKLWCEALLKKIGRAKIYLTLEILTVNWFQPWFRPDMKISLKPNLKNISSEISGKSQLIWWSLAPVIF